MKNTSITLILILFALVFSCKKQEEIIDLSLRVNFKYVNNINYDINLFVFSNDTLIREYKIAPTDTLSRTDIHLGWPPAFRYFDGDFAYEADSIYLTYSDQRYETFNLTDSIFMVDVYESVNNNYHEYDLFYYFDNADFERAKPISE